MSGSLNRKKIWQIIRCCYGYAISGMAVLTVGAVLPSLIEEARLSYAVAGGLLSLMAVGNLLASLIFPVSVLRFGRRASITFFSALVPICYLSLFPLPPVWVMYGLMFILGVSRGSVTILNNMVVDEVSGHSTRMLNYLHCSFAVGAFLAPFFTGFAISMGYGWRAAVGLLVLLCLSSAVFYGTGDYRTEQEERIRGQKKTGGIETAQGEPADKGKKAALVDFYVIAFLLFFYLGVENCVNGWFVTYLQSTGIMSASFATAMVSVTWLVIMAGRLLCAWLARRYSKNVIILVCVLGTSASFLLLLTARSIAPVTAALIGTGFFMSGVYPTSIAAAGPLIKGSAVGMSALTAVASIGGIITPQIVGSAADQVGMTAALSILLINIVMMCILAFASRIRERRRECLSRL